MGANWGLGVISQQEIENATLLMDSQVDRNNIDRIYANSSRLDGSARHQSPPPSCDSSQFSSTCSGAHWRLER